MNYHTRMQPLNFDWNDMLEAERLAAAAVQHLENAAIMSEAKDSQENRIVSDDDAYYESKRSRKIQHRLAIARHKLERIQRHISHMLDDCDED